MPAIAARERNSWQCLSADHHAGNKMISNLQVLRGLAALAVVFYHTAFTFNGGSIPIFRR